MTNKRKPMCFCWRWCFLSREFFDPWLFDWSDWCNLWEMKRTHTVALPENCRTLRPPAFMQAHQQVFTHEREGPLQESVTLQAHVFWDPERRVYKQDDIQAHNENFLRAHSMGSHDEVISTPLFVDIVSSIERCSAACTHFRTEVLSQAQRQEHERQHASARKAMSDVMSAAPLSPSPICASFRCFLDASPPLARLQAWHVIASCLDALGAMGYRPATLERGLNWAHVVVHMDSTHVRITFRGTSFQKRQDGNERHSQSPLDPADIPETRILRE